MDAEMNERKSRRIAILPQVLKHLVNLGQNLRLARLRREIPLVLMAERAGITGATLIKIEKGDPTVSMGAYLQVAHYLGFSKELGQVAENDLLGRKLQDIGIKTRLRAPKRKKAADE